MRKALAMVCLAGFLVACGGSDDKKTDPAVETNPAPEQMKPVPAAPAPAQQVDPAPAQPAAPAPAPATEQTPSQDSSS